MFDKHPLPANFFFKNHQLKKNLIIKTQRGSFHVIALSAAFEKRIFHLENSFNSKRWKKREKREKWTDVERELAREKKKLLPTSIFKRRSFKELWTNSGKCGTKTSLGSYSVPLFFPCLKHFKCHYNVPSERFMKSREFQPNLKIKSYRCSRRWIIKITRSERKSKQTPLENTPNEFRASSFEVSSNEGIN